MGGEKIIMSIKYKKEQLPTLTQWKIMGESEYVVSHFSYLQYSL